MKEPMESERRHFYRFDHSQPVRLEFKDPSQAGGCLSYDLSEGGVRVRLNDFVPPNTELALQIQLDNARIVECIGSIAWVEKSRFGDYYQAGLKFVGGDSLLESQRKINGFLFSQ